jgi:hypothetical protein
MFASRLYALFCTLSLLVAPGSCIIRCPSLDDLSRSQDVPLIDGKFEDCGFEGPLMGNYSGRSSISELTFDFNKDGSGLTEQILNFLISPKADLNSVREITFKGHNWAGNLPLVEHAFSKMHSLKKVH